jgi:hypothetical protein
VIKTKPFPLPKITDVLQKLEGFYVCYITGTLDLNMGCYHMLLTYHCTAMGLSISPDIFQEKMSELMAGLEFAHAHLDDLLILSTEKRV